MKMSKRAKRMQKHHKRNKRGAALNMVSLMDIFTILVFFLLVNSSTGEVLPSTKSISLPESISDKKPKETLSIVVSSDNILFQGQKIASVSEMLEQKSVLIKPLKERLDSMTKARARFIKKDVPFNGDVTIMADKTVPYSLLKKLMVTCTASNYGNISLAVMQKVEKG